MYREIIVVEVPHQRPAKAYKTDSDTLIDLAWNVHREWFMENGYFDEQPTLARAIRAIRHDLSACRYFDSLDEAQAYYSTAGRVHQHHKIIAELKRLADDELAKPQPLAQGELK